MILFHRRWEVCQLFLRIRSQVTSFELFLEISFPLSHRSAIKCGYFSQPWEPRYIYIFYYNTSNDNTYMEKKWMTIFTWRKNKNVQEIKDIREFKIWRRQRQQQRHKSIDLIDWMKKNRAARAVRLLVHCFDVVCQTTTWNFHIWGSNDNRSSQQ